MSASRSCPPSQRLQSGCSQSRPCGNGMERRRHAEKKPQTQYATRQPETVATARPNWLCPWRASSATMPQVRRPCQVVADSGNSASMPEQGSHRQRPYQISENRESACAREFGLCRHPADDRGLPAAHWRVLSRLPAVTGRPSYPQLPGPSMNFHGPSIISSRICLRTIRMHAPIPGQLTHLVPGSFVALRTRRRNQAPTKGYVASINLFACIPPEG